MDCICNLKVLSYYIQSITKQYADSTLELHLGYMWFWNDQSRYNSEVAESTSQITIVSKYHVCTVMLTSIIRVRSKDLSLHTFVTLRTNFGKYCINNLQWRTYKLEAFQFLIPNIQENQLLLLIIRLN